MFEEQRKLCEFVYKSWEFCGKNTAGVKIIVF